MGNDWHPSTRPLPRVLYVETPFLALRRLPYRHLSRIKSKGDKEGTRRRAIWSEDFSLRLGPITRRIFLGSVALLALGRAGARAARSETLLVTATIALVTAGDLLSLDPPQMLQRLAFRGGKPVKTEQPTGAAVYDIRDGVLTYGHVELAKRGDAWRLGTLSVLFSPDEKVPLAAFRDALTPKFGKPADRTTGNTVLVWTAADRVIRVTADPPGDPAMLVYAVTVAPR